MPRVKQAKFVKNICNTLQKEKVHLQNLNQHQWKVIVGGLDT